MASSLGTRKRSSQSISNTSTHDPPGPNVASGSSPGRAGQKRLQERTAGADEQLQHVFAPLVSTDEDEGMGILDHDPQPLEISDPSSDCVVQEQGEEEPAGAYNQLPQVSSSSGKAKNGETDVDIVQHSGQPSTISNPSPGCAEREHGVQEIPGMSEQIQHVPSCTESEEIVITAIRAADVALGLRRLPVGFYVVLHHNGLEWRTENKPSSVNNDVVEWSGPIPISSDLLAVLCLEVYASFEFQPMLGSGEQLRRLTTTVGQLLDRSTRDAPFTFFPKGGEVVSPCSFVLVTVKRQKHKNSDPSGSKVIGSHWSIAEPRGELEDGTDHGHSTLLRYRKHERKGDLDRSIEQFERALNACPKGHPCRAAAQSNLAMAKLILFKVQGTVAPLEVALGLYQDALAARPAGHPDRPITLIHLALVHFARFQRWRDHVDQANGEKLEALLHEAIQHSATESYEKRAATLMLKLRVIHRRGPVRSERQPSIEQNLTSSLIEDNPWILSVWLLERFERFGDLADLQQTITILEGLAKSTSSWDRKYPMAMGNLGLALQYRFERLGQLGDLEGAISRKRDAVDLTPDGHPDKSTQLSNLGNSLQTRFRRLGQLRDLEDAISTQRDAVRLVPRGHPLKSGYLNNLGNSLLIRFQRLGRLSDLEDAILALRDAVDLIPNGHPYKPMRLNNLGSSLLIRFKRLGQLSDAEDAVSALREAADLTPNDHPHKSLRLDNLSGSLQARFECLGRLSDLEEAISTQRDAIGLTPDDHPDKPIRLNNLGSSFQTRFERLGQLSDLRDGILAHRRAADLIPHDHPDKSTCLANLGNSFQIRFERLGQLSDLEDAISTHRNAVDLTPLNHPLRANYLNNLANSFIARFARLQQVNDLKRALFLFSHVASIPVGSPSVRFSAAQRWILCARLIHHSSLLHAYSVAVRLLPQLAWIGLSISHRYDELARSAGVVQEAAAAALDAGFPQTALEWLEQGRSIIWGDLFQLRSSYEELSCAHPSYASRLYALSAQLDRANGAHEQLLSALSEQSQSGAYHTAESLQQVADRHRALAIERDKLLQEIRQLPGFEKFLLRKPFSQLRAAAHSGPVVILNAAKTRCDALIVVAGVNRVIHVPLPNFTSERCANLQVILRSFVRDTRVGKLGRWEGISWDHILSPLWKCIVKPVLDALAFSVTPDDPSRIFWCPTGPLTFLPIHAAGFYNGQYSEPGHKIFDFVVSSYVPTLGTLLLSPKHNSTPATPPSGALHFLLVPQPPSDGQAKLPGVAIELRRINSVISNSPLACTVLEPSIGTVEEVLGLMRHADWVHFACHGAQDGVDSGLCLANRRRLRLRDIVALSRPRGGLAFLSACQTAKGDQRLSDEAIHIAAGILFAGYGGVIGTMWSISDAIAPDVAKDVYEELLGRGSRADYRKAAWALHEATKDLRKRGVPFDEWIPFIHVGL